MISIGNMTLCTISLGWLTPNFSRDLSKQFWCLLSDRKNSVLKLSLETQSSYIYFCLFLFVVCCLLFGLHLQAKNGPMISPLSVCQYVSSKHVFAQMAYRIFLKLLMKLTRCLKCKTLMEQDFWEKISFCG